MANYTSLKDAVAQVIKTNGNQEITGAILQSTLLSIVNGIGVNRTFAGIATPTTAPGTPDANIFYLASTAGSYVNFDNITVNPAELAVIVNTTFGWSKTTIVAGMAAFATFKTGAFDMISGWITKFDGTGGCGFDMISLEQSGDSIEIVVTPGFSSGYNMYSFTGKKNTAFGGISISGSIMNMRDDAGNFLLGEGGITLNGMVKTKIKIEVVATNYNVYVDDVLKRTVAFSKMTFNRMGYACPKFGYWVGLVHSIKTNQRGTVAEYTTVDKLPGFVNDDGTGAKMWNESGSFLDPKTKQFLESVGGVAIVFKAGDSGYLTANRDVYTLNEVGDYVETVVANPIVAPNNGSGIRIFGGTKTSGGYNAGSFYFRSNSNSGSDYRVWDLPAGFDQKQYHLIRLAHAADGWELFVDGVSMGVKPISTNANIQWIGKVDVATTPQYNIGSVTVHSNAVGDITVGAYSLFENSTGSPTFLQIPDGTMDILMRLTTVENQTAVNTQTISTIVSAFSNGYYSSYNSTDALSKTTLITPVQIKDVGDYVEIYARYTGSEAGYADKINLMGGVYNVQFGWYSDTQFWIRKSTTYVKWNNLTANIAEWNKIRLSVVAGGWELFINDVSQGVRAMAETGGMTFNKVATSDGSPQKYDVQYLSFHNASGDIRIAPLAMYPGSQNVLLVTQEENDTSVVNPVCMVKFVKYTGSTGSSQRDYFDIAMRDKQNQNIYYVMRVVNINSVGMVSDPIVYSNQWRIILGYLARYNPTNGTMTTLYNAIITNGENECVWQDTSGRIVDFTGGAHGDERLDVDPDSFVTFFVDGVALTDAFRDATSDWIKCNEFSYLQRSTMHKTASRQANYDTGLSAATGDGVLTIDQTTYHFLIDGVDTGIVAYDTNGMLTSTGGLTTSKTGSNTWAISSVIVLSDHAIVCDHWKHTIFTNCGYTTNNRLTYRVAVPLYWYHGISCLGKQVSNKGYNEKYIITDYTGSGKSPAPTTGVGNRQYWTWHTDNMLSAKVTSRLIKGGDDADCYMFIWDVPGYSKYYRRFPSQNGTITPAVNDTYESTMTVEFNYKAE